MALVIAPGAFADVVCVSLVNTSDGSGAQCQTLFAGQAINAGTVCVSVVEVYIWMNSPYTLDKTRVYIGSKILPRIKQGEFTVAPGQYGREHTLNGATNDNYLNLEGYSGDIYVIAHAGVCGPGIGAAEGDPE